ncbi:hypothetical protein EUV02_03905 [Polymorphobacter arshaanensis]|uniref:Scaffolding protein n=1 Tax=Glacieibacterium arshaanense TaxID=2511025 RepID=A0A4Y9ERB7_9SPHN|nr:hypothetical protein [Polymorphobacter arshaanensis]TFU06165.1 hypothetical protein EUV02_03905 [Polymorphobacter arshaanensis]
MSIHSLDDTNTNDSALSEDAAIEALTARWEGAEKATSTTGSSKTSKATESETDEEDEGTIQADDANDEDGTEPEDEGTDANEEDPAGNEKSDKSEAPQATDDHIVTISVDGQDVTVPIKDLKRLYGQEASLTRKSQEVAAVRKEADEIGGRYAAALQATLEDAQSQLKEFEGIDWLVLQTELSPEDFKAYRGMAVEANKRYQTVLGKAQEFTTDTQTRQTAETQRRAMEAVETLKRDIPNWSDELYGSIRAYGVSQGLEANDVDNIVDASVIKLLHKAMLYDKGKTAVTKKVEAAPAKTFKSGTGERPTAELTSVKKTKVLTERLRKTGSTDDAVALLMGRWGAKG